MKEIKDRLKVVQLEILNEFHNFCMENDIKYSLSGGTLLGAIRHKGFIPWDDDIDVMMVRSEYIKFKKLYKSDKFYIQDIDNSDDYRLPFLKLMKKGTTFIETGSEKFNYEKGIFIDVFPIDLISDKFFSMIKIKIIASILWILYRKDIFSERKKAIGKFVNTIFKNRLYWIHKFTNILANSKGDLYAELNYGGHNIAKFCNRDLFEQYSLTEFEGNKYYIIKYYDFYLKRYYNNYMELPPIEKRVGGHEYSEIDFGESL